MPYAYPGRRSVSRWNIPPTDSSIQARFTVEHPPGPPRSTVERVAYRGLARMGTIISLLNQKGGVGKTSTCHHLAGTLAKDGRCVLLIDNDPQASLSQGFWGPDATRQIGAVSCVPTITQSSGAAFSLR